MKLGSGKKLLTLKDVAERIAFDRSDAGIARIMRQIRHWTQCDLIETASEKSTGKGIPRLYELEPTVEVAAILLELSRYGATVDILKPVAERLYGQWEGHEPYLGSAFTDIDAYLQVSWVTDPETGKFVDAEVSFFDDWDPPEEKAPLSDRPSSILIYMNKVIESIEFASDDFA